MGNPRGSPKTDNGGGLKEPKPTQKPPKTIEKPTKRLVTEQEMWVKVPGLWVLDYKRWVFIIKMLVSHKLSDFYTLFTQCVYFV